MAYLKYLVTTRFRIVVALIAFAAMATPVMESIVDRPRFLTPVELARLRQVVTNRDIAMAEYLHQHKGLDTALSVLYEDHNVDRIKYDINLDTGEFIPYRDGRAPNIPPTFLRQKRKD